MGIELLYSLGISLILTLILEVCFLYICRIRDKKDRILLILVNILTNPLAVMSYVIVFRYSNMNPIAVVTVLELFAVLTEGHYYKAYSRTIRHPMLFSLGANLFSYSIGQLLNLLL